MSQQIVCDIHGGQMLTGEDYWTITRFTGGSLNICARCGKSTSVTSWVDVLPTDAGAVVRPTAGIGEYVYEAANTGTTGATEPTWPTVAGGDVLDGDVVWVARGAPLGFALITVPQNPPTPDVETTFLGWWLRLLDPLNPSASQPR